MSRTIGSPAAITRSDASWWGEAELGPEPTIAKWASSWPSAMSRSRTSRATSASVRPTSRPAAIWATTRSAAWAAAVSSAISSGSLTIRSRPSTGDPSSNDASSRRSSRRSRCRAGRSSETAMRIEPAGDAADPAGTGSGRDPVADHAGHERVRILRLLPRHDRQVPGRGRRTRPGRRRLEQRRDERGAPAGRDDEHREALERHRRIAGQVAHVGPHADEDRGEAGLLGERGGGCQAFAVALGRDRRTRRRSCRRLHACDRSPATRRAGVGRPRTGADTDGPDPRPPPSARRRRATSSCWPTARTGRPAACASAIARMPSYARAVRSTITWSTAGRAAVSAAIVRSATTSPPAPRTRSARRVAQMRSSARMATRAVSRASPRGGGRRRAP